MKISHYSILFLGIFSLVSFTAKGADVPDSGQDAVSAVLAQGKGLIVRVPVTENGEDTSQAEYRVDGGNVSSKDALPQAWDKGFDITGFAEISKPDEHTGSGSSTCYYCCYSPVVWHGSYYWYYYAPVYVTRVVYVYTTYVYYYYPTWYSYYRW